MDILLFLDAPTICNERAMLAIMGIAKLVLLIIRILVPIALIVLGSIDIGKAVVAGDEKKIKEAQKPFVKRIVAAVLVFLIPWIVDVIMGIINSTAKTEYSACYNMASSSLSDIQCYLNQEKDIKNCNVKK